MKLLIYTLTALFAFSTNAHAGIFDDIKQGASNLVDTIKDKTEEKEMTSIKLPLSAIKRGDAKIEKIESKVVQVAMKKKYVIVLSCPDTTYCKQIEEGLREKAWIAARAKTNSDYAAKAFLPKITLSKADDYTINLYKKGIKYDQIFN